MKYYPPRQKQNLCFLQVKYFDSGDYNVAKDKVLKQKLQINMPHSMSNNESISQSGGASSGGGSLESPEIGSESLFRRSLSTSNTDSSINTIEAIEADEMLKQSTGDTIPTPENVPAVIRKKSFLHQTSHLSRSDSHSFEAEKPF